jgi:hypothetical protein
MIQCGKLMHDMKKKIIKGQKITSSDSDFKLLVHSLATRRLSILGGSIFSILILFLY